MASETRHNSSITLWIPKFGLKTLAYVTLVIALIIGWYVDRTRLQHLVSHLNKHHEKEKEKLFAGLTSYIEANGTISLLQRSQKHPAFGFRKFLESDAFVLLETLYRKKGHIDSLNLNDARHLARELVSLLGCGTVESFLTKAREYGLSENDFIMHARPINDDDIITFYQFLGLRDE